MMLHFLLNTHVEHFCLWFQMGFDGLFFGRADYEDIDQRKKTKTMEMMWKGSPKNLGSI